MEIQNLKNTSIAELTNCFNTSFANYMVALQLNAGQLQQKFKNDNIRPEFSAGAFEDNKLIGFIFIGIGLQNGVKLAYNGGTGVLPGYRGHGLTKRMYDFLLPKLKNEGVETCILEVIDSNIPAIKTYERIGFRKVRNLICFKGIPEITEHIPEGIWFSEDFSNIKNLKEYFDFEPSWQNTQAAVRRSRSGLKSLIIQKNKEPLAFIIFNPDNGRISQFGVHKNHRGKGYGRILFKEVSQYLQRPLTLINIDLQSTASIDFLSRIGLEPFLTQFEMKMDL